MRQRNLFCAAASTWKNIEIHTHTHTHSHRKQTFFFAPKSSPWWDFPHLKDNSIFTQMDDRNSQSHKFRMKSVEFSWSKNFCELGTEKLLFQFAPPKKTMGNINRWISRWQTTAVMQDEMLEDLASAMQCCKDDLPTRWCLNDRCVFWCFLSISWIISTGHSILAQGAKALIQKCNEHMAAHRIVSCQCLGGQIFDW